MMCRLARPLPILLLQVCAAACAQEKVPAAPLTQGEDVLSFPSFGRIVLSFIIAAALAVGVAFALRYVLPKLGRPAAASSRLRVLDRIHISSGLRLHLVEVDGDKVLIAEQRGAPSMLVLPASQPQPTLSE
jgi:flagellar biogenesis protein FliO